jgi:D-alanine-D-alanine ligase
VRLGLTYDLRDDYLAAGYSEEQTAEFDRPETIDALERALRELGHRVERIGHVRALAARLAAGERWDLVFNVAEGLAGVGRESQVPALLEAFDTPYTFSDPLVCALTLHKAMAKRVLRDLGVPTADFRVVESEADIAAVDLAGTLFVKPLAEGTAKGIDAASVVRSRAELERACRRVLREFGQPALVEPFLSGAEVTVGITGTGARAAAVGTLEVVLREDAEPLVYSYENKEQCERLCDYRLAAPRLAARAEALALDAWRGLGCRDAGRVDLRCDAAGELYVLELNPLPGLHPTHSDLPILASAVGLAYRELIGRIVESASERTGESPRALAVAAG